MSLSLLAAIVVFLVSVVLSKKIAVEAAMRLDGATKLKIVEVFPKRNMNYTMIVFGIVIVFLFALYALPQYVFIISIAYAAVFGIYIFTKLFLNVKKLKEIAAPESYIRSVIISFAVFIGGAVAAVIVFTAGNSGLAR
jgi:hypothetical protein